MSNLETFLINIEACHHAALIVDQTLTEFNGVASDAAIYVRNRMVIGTTYTNVRTFATLTLASMQLAQEKKAAKDQRFIDDNVQAGDDILSGDRTDTVAVLRYLAIAWAMVGGTNASIKTANWYNVFDVITDIEKAFPHYSELIHDKILPSELIV